MTNNQVMERLRNQFGAEPPQGAKERVWARLQEQRTRAFPFYWSLLAAGAVAALAMVASRRDGAPEPGQARIMQALGSVALVNGDHRSASVGESALGEDTWVETTDGQTLVGVPGDYLLWAVEGTRFRVQRDSRKVIVHLDRGQVHLWSAPRGRNPLWVVTPHHRGAVVGTVFSVEYADGGERFAVARGKVDVYDGETRIAHLSGGEAWAAGLEALGVSDGVVSLLEAAAAGRAVHLQAPAPAPKPVVAAPSQALMGLPPVAEPASPTAASKARPRRTSTSARPVVVASAPAAAAPVESETDRMAREAEAFERSGEYKSAAQRYESLARGAGIDAEWALYRLGKLRARYLGDRSGALAAWREHRRRFPAGSLRQEVDLSIVEALVRLGQNQEALVEAERFLAQYPASERRDELARIKERLQP